MSILFASLAAGIKSRSGAGAAGLSNGYGLTAGAIGVAIFAVGQLKALTERGDEENINEQGETLK